VKTFDLINALFQLGGALAAWKNVQHLWRDRQIRGIFWPLTIYYAIWGLWNLAFFSHLAQWWSLASGTMLVSGNIVWSSIALHHHLKKTRQRRLIRIITMDTTQIAQFITVSVTNQDELEKKA
jgi:hypothetical protein